MPPTCGIERLVSHPVGATTRVLLVVRPFRGHRHGTGVSTRTLPSPLGRPYTRRVMSGDESLLDVVDEGTRDDLVRRMRRRRFGRGEVIYRDGDPGDAIHLVDKGHALVRISTPLGDEVILDVVGRGELLAISGLLTPGRRHVGTATALGPVQTRSLPWSDVEQLRETEPRLERFLTGMLARQQQRLIGYVLEALYVPADVRVLRRLEELCTRIGIVEGDGTVVTISQEDLGAMAGTTRPTANRALTAASAEGIVSLGRGRITVVDPRALAGRTGRP